MKENLYEKLLQDISKLFLIFQLKKLINYTRLNKKEELFYLLRMGFINPPFFSNKYSHLRLHQLFIYVNMYLV